MARAASIFRPKVGLGQSLALTSGAAKSFTNKVGANTFAIALSVTGANCTVCVSSSSTPATASSDILVKDTDPPLILACAPGDNVSAWGLAASATLYLAELSG